MPVRSYLGHDSKFVSFFIYGCQALFQDQVDFILPWRPQRLAIEKIIWIYLTCHFVAAAFIVAWFDEICVNNHHVEVCVREAVQSDPQRHSFWYGASIVTRCRKGGWLCVFTNDVQIQNLFTRSTITGKAEWMVLPFVCFRVIVPFWQTRSL